MGMWRVNPKRLKIEKYVEVRIHDFMDFQNCRYEQIGTMGGKKTVYINLFYKRFIMLYVLRTIHSD